MVSKQPPQLIIAAEIRHNRPYFGSNETLIVRNGAFFHRGFMLYRVLFFCKRPFLAMFGQPAANSFCFYDPHHGLRTPNEAFCHCNPELLGRQVGQINSGVFSAELSAVLPLVVGQGGL